MAENDLISRQALLKDGLLFKNGIDEWLPFKCELLDACPNPCGVACWEQYLKYKDRKEETLQKYGFTLEAKYKEA